MPRTVGTWFTEMTRQNSLFHAAKCGELPDQQASHDKQHEGRSRHNQEQPRKVRHPHWVLFPPTSRYKVEM